MLDLSSELLIETTMLGFQVIDFKPDNGDRMQFMKVHVTQPLKNGEGFTTAIWRKDGIDDQEFMKKMIGKKIRVKGVTSGNDSNTTIKIVSIEAVNTAVKAA